jgi:hypothetical protein
MESMIKCTVSIQEDLVTGEQFIIFPEEVMTGVGWQEGDTIIWKDNGDGSWTLTRKEDEKLSG